jgi:hypothetical protein
VQSLDRFGVSPRSWGAPRVSTTVYSGSGRSSVVWHSVQTHVRMTTFV